MTFEDAMREIESHEFASRINIAANVETLMRIAAQENAVRDILQELDLPARQTKLFQRTLELVKSRVDIRYENPWDVAFTIYLWLVSLKNQTLARLLAVMISRAPQCWWATRIAHSLLTQSASQSDAGLVDSISTIYQAIVFNMMGGANTGETLLPIGYFGKLEQPVFTWHFIDSYQRLRDESRKTWRFRVDIPSVYTETGDKSGVEITG